MPKIDKKTDGTWLPDYLIPAHDLCFLHHDILVELLRSAEAEGSFSEHFEFRDEEDKKAFEDSADLFEWFARTGRRSEQAHTLRWVVFPALLSDLLHFVYEALESSRKAKLGVAYALIRKPLQENLFLLETIATDVDGFAEKLANNPLLLRAQKAGGLDVHTRRISEVLGVLGERDRFDARYLAQLRYDKTAEDGFDGICNKAVHLFTEHKAIMTERMNVNFIFGGEDAKRTQWYFLYSRLPYVLDYVRAVIEHVFGHIATTNPVYLAEMDRRIMASTLLWAPAVDPHYREPTIERYVDATRTRLGRHCVENGYVAPRAEHLRIMKQSGAFPGESAIRMRFRHLRSTTSALPRHLRRLWSERAEGLRSRS